MTFTVCVGTVRPDTLGHTVESIKRQRFGDWELLLIGQGVDSTLRNVGEALARADRRIRYLHLRERGLSRARNAGLREARGEIVAFTDDDCEAAPDWLSVLDEIFTVEPDVGLVGGKVDATAGPKHVLSTCPEVHPTETLYDPVATQRRAPRGWGWIGANFAMRASVAARIGFFDEQLGAGTQLPAGEDTDYMLRMEAQGIKMRCTPRAIVHHTYGRRFGFKALLQNSRNYARGNGALAAKLSLFGDRRGTEWLDETFRESTVDVVRRLALHRLPFSLRRLWHYRAGYRHCHALFRADKERSVLVPREA